MPELPEVETVKKQLHKKVAGKSIHSIDVLDSKVIDLSITSKLPLTIQKVTRRGKTLVFHLSNNLYLLGHLRMTGYFRNISPKQDVGKYCAGIFHLSDNSMLTYNTIRRFGSVILVDEEQFQTFSHKIGPEPLTNNFTKEKFSTLMKRYPNSPIKNKLLDQKAIAGIGNIYAMEACYHAGIHPSKKIGEISKQKLYSLHHHLQRILEIAISQNGTTMYNYSHMDGKGDFQNLLAVYNKERCPKDHLITKIKLAGRGTYYCKICQG